jgi:galactoside O-acetyltransferase
MIIRFVIKIALEALTWLYNLMNIMPGKIGVLLRRVIFKCFFNNCGKKLTLDSNIQITGFKNINLGNFVQVSRYSSIHAHNNGKIIIGDRLGMNTNSTIGAADGGEIIIGDDVMIAQNVVVRASDHEFKDIHIPISQQGHRGGKIVIGNGCWIAANVVITSNVAIGEHCIVAAGAVVTCNIEPYSIVGGVPAKLISKRN